uniref:Uncharacterized protein n=1 Tax=Aegilops tauschii subsp. strangulata TaxID=200361 RepID=A0A453IVD3_AEGTS
MFSWSSHSDNDKQRKQLDAVKFIQALYLAHKYQSVTNTTYARPYEQLFLKMLWQDAGYAKEPTLLGALQEFMKEDKL